MSKAGNILIQNIYYMLSYAFRFLKDSHYQNLGDEPFDHMDDLLAALITKGINRQIKRGIYKTYKVQKEEAPHLKGKLIVRDSMMLQLRNKKRLTLEIDELSENNLLNRIIKSTLVFLANQKRLRSDIRNNIQKTLFHLDGIETVDLKKLKRRHFQVNRNHQEYFMLIALCFMVVDRLIISENHKGYFTRGLKDDQTLPILFEKFVLEYYRFHYPQISVKAAHVSWDISEGPENLLPRMESDITLKYQDKTLIIDTKFYRNIFAKSQYDDEKSKFDSRNLYQIFSYVQNADTLNDGSVSGLLLYAKTNEIISPNADFKIKGNMIATRSIDLNTKFLNIENQLNEIVNRYLFRQKFF